MKLSSPGCVMSNARLVTRRVLLHVVCRWPTQRILVNGWAPLNILSSTSHRGEFFLLFLPISILICYCSARPLDMVIHIQSFTINHFPSLMIAMSKPAYIAIKEYSPSKPVIIFVPSRRQCRLSVDDLLTHCAADDQPDLFLNIDLEDLQPHLDYITDKGLVETLKHGIGYFHEALTKQDKRIVQRLFESGAIQVLVASKVCKHIPSSRTESNCDFAKTRHGAFPSPATWSLSWECSPMKARSIATLTTL